MSCAVRPCSAPSSASRSSASSSSTANPPSPRSQRDYTIDGHPAAIVLASVPCRAVKGKIPTTTYAAKACVLGNIPVKPKKVGPVEPTRHVLCFDFTTEHSDLYTLMFAFSMQFDNDAPLPMVPGSVIR